MLKVNLVSNLELNKFKIKTKQYLLNSTKKNYKQEDPTF